MRYIKKLMMIFTLVLLYHADLNAGYKENMFFEANKHYSEGSYSEAVRIYEELISTGVKSGNLYYNLGNAYFKLGERGRAVLNYERAYRLIPQDEDLFANTAFVKTVLDAAQPEEDYRWYERLFITVRDIFSPDIWFINSVVLFYIMCFLIALSFLKYQFRRTAYMISALLGMLFIFNLFFFGKSYAYHKNMNEGVIVVPKTEVRYSPSYSGAVAFELMEGMKANIIRRTDDWVHIRLNRKNSGWVESDAIEKI